MLEGSLPRSRKHFNFLNFFSPRFFQHPSSVSALRADPPSPTRGEGHSRVLAEHLIRRRSSPRTGRAGPGPYAAHACLRDRPGC
ncbi:MAG: hypothetical protein E5Y55_06905 [Mesorhizobium sp.]|nr:MAG: hypothetical protein E5Y55_06905 [Mesorhizobium sp.]